MWRHGTVPLQFVCVGRYHPGAAIFAQATPLLSRLDVRTKRKDVLRHSTVAGKSHPLNHHPPLPSLLPYFTLGIAKYWSFAVYSASCVVVSKRILFCCGAPPLLSSIQWDLLQCMFRFTFLVAVLHPQGRVQLITMLTSTHIVYPLPHTVQCKQRTPSFRKTMLPTLAFYSILVFVLLSAFNAVVSVYIIAFL